VAGCRKWQIWVAAIGSSGDCPQVGLRKYWGCCNQVCQMTNVREGFPGILRVIIASPLDQIFPFLPNSLLGQNSLHCIHPTTLIRVQRRWCSHRHRSRMWWQRKRERDETPVRLEHSAESVTSRSVPGLPSSPRRVPLSRTFISGPGSFLPKILHISGPGSFLPFLPFLPLFIIIHGLKLSWRASKWIDDLHLTSCARYTAHRTELPTCIITG
jgi:hypothetical protein